MFLIPRFYLSHYRFEVEARERLVLPGERVVIRVNYFFRSATIISFTQRQVEDLPRQPRGEPVLMA